MSDRPDPKKPHTIPPLHGAWEKDCREQFHAAIESGDDRAYADWARRWGLALTKEQGRTWGDGFPGGIR